MDIRPIKTPDDYRKAIAEIERLMLIAPKPESCEWNKLEVLTSLVSGYEGEHFVFDMCDPIDAIALVMEQKGMKATDLIPYLGSKSRVSEVFGRKRTLSLNMIKALHEGLDIPANVLIRSFKQTSVSPTADMAMSFSRQTIEELQSRGWQLNKESTASASLSDLAASAAQRIHELLNLCVSPVFPRSSAFRSRFRDTVDEGALVSWQARVIEKAINPVNREKITTKADDGLLQEVVSLSRLSDGPLKAIELLRQYGIIVVVEPLMARTYLDGGAMLLRDGMCAIGLTLRHDRLDNFWFTLMHELVHAIRHLDSETAAIIDDLDCGSEGNREEEEADQLARDTLIPAASWNHSKAEQILKNRASPLLIKWALDLKVHPSIVAGRIRHEFNNYSVFSKFLGKGDPSRFFRSSQS